MDLITHYSNTPELLNDLRTTLRAIDDASPDEPELGAVTQQPPARPWSMAERLSSADQQELVRSFLEDRATKAELATRYGISAKSVQRLLRKHGVRRSQHSKNQDTEPDRGHDDLAP